MATWVESIYKCTRRSPGLAASCVVIEKDFIRAQAKETMIWPGIIACRDLLH